MADTVRRVLKKQALGSWAAILESRADDEGRKEGHVQVGEFTEWSLKGNRGHRQENPFESYMWFLSKNLEGINLKPSQRLSEDTNLDGNKISGLAERS